MKLKQTIINQGYFLFRYRSYFPIVLFIMAVPFLYLNANSTYSNSFVNISTIISILICLFGFFIRAYTIGTTPKGTSGRNTKEQVAMQLNTHGIYSIVRHPLYLGNFLMWAGIVAFTFSISFLLIFILLFFIYYERIMAAEEDFIETKFGEQFCNWAKQTPAFFPLFKNYKKNTLTFSIKSVLRREYSGFLAAVIAFTFIDYVRFFFKTNNFAIVRFSLYVLLVSIIITLFLRTLKHYTSLLNEENRS